MDRIRWAFAGLFFIILILSIFILNTFQAPFSPEIQPISEFQLTAISANGTVYDTPDMTRIIDVKRTRYPGEIYLKADLQTSFEFFYGKTFFLALPGSSLFFQSKTKELYVNGEFLWRKEARDEKVDLYPVSAGKISDIADSEQILSDRTGDGSYQMVTLSLSGRILVEDARTTIWTYDGVLAINHDGMSHSVNSPKIVISEDGRLPVIASIPSAPQFISPMEKTVQLDQPGDSIVKFSWKNVPSVNNYVLRLYNSRLMENAIFEKILSGNRKNIDLLKFDNISELYWQVSPYDIREEYEGVPSPMGYIRIQGAILDREKFLRPPSLEITSLTVSGNMVLIKGSADANSQLLVNDNPVQIDMEGKFIHTLTFNTMGSKDIVFKLISPSEIETVVRRRVSIFEE